MTNNIVRMAFYLVLSLAATAGLVLSGRGRFRRRDATDDLCRRHAGAVDLRRHAHGPGALHLDEDPRRRMDAGGMVGGGAAGVLLAGGLQRAMAARRARPSRSPVAAAAGAHGRAIWAWACWASRVDKLDEADPVRARGMSGYLLPFEIVSVHLLVVLIGAAYLARPKRRSAGRAERPCDANGPRRTSKSLTSRDAMNLLTQPVGVSHYLVVGAIMFVSRRGLHGHEAQRPGRADGHRAGAQRGQRQLRGLWQRVSAARRRPASGWTAS